jgi:hypothetical protein
MKKIGPAVRAILVILLALLCLGGMWVCRKFSVELPKYPPIQNVVWLDQNWTVEQRNWFHHIDQGTQTFGIPYEWFIALEQPTLSLSNPGLLSDPTYLDRYGFIPDASSTKAELPIGFAHGTPLKNSDGTPTLNPQTKAPMTSLGLTCAACHTGRFTYKNTTILIDGGPALIDLAQFQKGVGVSLIFTQCLPFRFDRFADRVLGPRASSQAKSDLRKELKPVVSEVFTILGLENKNKSQTITEGYARLDALNRIGNTAFAIDLNQPANYVGYSAPVHFPRIWQASWFEWVQYNGSIQQPMTRNAGEALGVGAKVNLTGSKDQLFASSIQIPSIFELEQALAGSPAPTAKTEFNGLTSPKWRDPKLAQILPPIDTDLAAKGAALYKDRCEPCHMPPVSEPKFWSSNRWSPASSAGGPFLDLEMIPITHVGTDSAEAEDMKNRRVVLPPSLGITSNEFGLALGQLVELTVNRWYDTQQPPTSEEVRKQWNGNRPNGVRAELSYKVRPLNGIWATPPYLHNGSVPTLYDLLSPVEERPEKFYLGNREYDPVKVGYRTEPFPKGFEFDTSIRGNHNTGHEFSDDSKKQGVIGAALTPDERRALIEYLKTL